jgi:diacylglycerol kinase family enzyme
MLDVSIFPDFGKVELLRYYAAMMDGGYAGDGKILHYQVKKLKIKTSPRLDVMADGVSLGKGTVKIKVRPGAIQIITAMKSPELVSRPNLTSELPSEQEIGRFGKNHATRVR